jgi:hypothetical protein
VPADVKLRDQLARLKDPRVLKYCQYYSIVFGGYVALSLWMVQYYVGEYGLDIRTAALLAACFSLPGGVLRAIGGWLSDKYGAHQRHLVGDVGELDLPVPAELPADRIHDPARSTARDLPRRPERLRLHGADVRAGHRLGLRQGQRLQVHQRRLPGTTSAPSAASSAWPAAWAASCCPSCSAR